MIHTIKNLTTTTSKNIDIERQAAHDPSIALM